jgi:hypothetical protein
MKLRKGDEVVVLAGSELSLFNKGFLPGETLKERLALLSGPPQRLREALPQVPARINAFLGRAAAVIRERFGGKISYASIPLERVDWSPFDYIASDAGYRSGVLTDQYRSDIRAFVSGGKPAAVTEVGCPTYRGAAERGARGVEIVEWDEATVTPLRLNGEFVRDEAEQARSLRESLSILDAEGVDSVFVHCFACYHLPHRAEPRVDLDMASTGVVKVLEGRTGEAYPDMRWEPKAAFAVIADYYRS